MDKKLNDSFLRLEECTSTIIQDLSVLTDEEFRWRPGEAKWSAGEICAHLMTAERMTLSYLRKKIAGAASMSDTGFREECIFFLLKWSQRVPLKFRAPEVVVTQTPAAGTLSESVHQWRTVRSDMSDFLQSVPEQFLGRKLFRHPVAGLLNVRHAVQFMYEHVNHHRPQFYFILRRLGK